jgi:hypothetical protein
MHSWRSALSAVVAQQQIARSVGPRDQEKNQATGSMAPPDRRIAVMSQCLINLHVSRKSVLPPTPPKTRSWWLAAS